MLDTSEIARNQVPPGTVENLNDHLPTPIPFLTWGTATWPSAVRRATRRYRFLAAGSRSRWTRSTERSPSAASVGRGAGSAWSMSATRPHPRSWQVQAGAELACLPGQPEGRPGERAVHLVLIAQPDGAAGPRVRGGLGVTPSTSSAAPAKGGRSGWVGSSNPLPMH